MNRRNFLRAGGGALLVLPFGTFLVQACYGTDTSDGDVPAGPPAVSGSNAVYTSNIDGGHSHTFSISLSAFTAPAATQGQTSVDDGHAHSVAIAAADLQSVQTGQTVKVTTGTSESHTHVLTIVKVA
jgi:hypothetical protein